jgi:hypothetical protein
MGFHASKLQVFIHDGHKLQVTKSCSVESECLFLLLHTKYMPALAHMKLLIGLAKIDGKVTIRERNYIVNIGRANGIYPDQIEPLFDQSHEIIVPEGLSLEQKFNYICTLVQLMKIDERMYKEELLFCSAIATRLGYDKQVMFELMLHVTGDSMEDNELNSLKKLTEKYIVK